MCDSSSTYVLLAALGALTPLHLLTSVALMAPNQTALSSSNSSNRPSQTTTPQQLGDPQTSGGSYSSGLILFPAAEPFPNKIVDKVKSGQFVEMRELLTDNIALLQQLEDIQGFPLPTVGATRP